MRINGIEFLVMLIIGDMDSDNAREFYFSDFEELNRFIREHQHNPQYQEGPFFYTLVESINGKPSAFCWTQEIEFRPFTQEQIQEEINAEKSFLLDLPKYANEMEQNAKEIHYTEEYDHYKDKVDRLNEFTYVCPNCIREIEDCRCSSYPYYLVQIDRLMLPIIRELNKNGYRTTGCCAGHPVENNPISARVYINFKKPYSFSEPLPEGAIWSKIANSISFETNCKNYKDLLAFQQDSLDKLSDWAEMLLEVEEKD